MSNVIGAQKCFGIFESDLTLKRPYLEGAIGAALSFVYPQFYQVLSFCCVQFLVCTVCSPPPNLANFVAL